MEIRTRESDPGRSERSKASGLLHHPSAEVERRLAIAQPIGATYAAAPDAMAILVGGSVARGHADRWSDLEIGVFWHILPPEHSRAGLAALAGLSDWRSYPDPSPVGALEEDGIRGGIKVDLIHLDCASVENPTTAVVGRGDPAIEHQVLLGTLQDGLPLAGHPLLATWNARIATYPEKFRIAMIRINLIFGPHAWLEMLAQRNDFLVLHDLFCRIGRSIVSVMLGINGIYTRSPALKWVHQTIAVCTIAPANLAHRLDTLLRADPRTAVATAGLLIDETLTLIDQLVPGVDTDPVRQRISALPRDLTRSTTP